MPFYRKGIFKCKCARGFFDTVVTLSRETVCAQREERKECVGSCTLAESMQNLKGMPFYRNIFKGKCVRGFFDMVVTQCYVVAKYESRKSLQRIVILRKQNVGCHVRGRKVVSKRLTISADQHKQLRNPEWQSLCTLRRPVMIKTSPRTPRLRASAVKTQPNFQSRYRTYREGRLPMEARSVLF
jgi:hypothetical protein